MGVLFLLFELQTTDFTNILNESLYTALTIFKWQKMKLQSFCMNFWHFRTKIVVLQTSSIA